jgi:hypothetical protein
VRGLTSVEMENVTIASRYSIDAIVLSDETISLLPQKKLTNIYGAAHLFHNQSAEFKTSAPVSQDNQTAFRHKNARV